MNYRRGGRPGPGNTGSSQSRTLGNVGRGAEKTCRARDGGGNVKLRVLFRTRFTRRYTYRVPISTSVRSVERNLFNRFDDNNVIMRGRSPGRPLTAATERNGSAITLCTRVKRRDYETDGILLLILLLCISQYSGGFRIFFWVGSGSLTFSYDKFNVKTHLPIIYHIFNFN